MEEKISVIVPVYNRESVIADCVTSILNQTHKNFEVLLINDGSTDNSEKVISSIKSRDERIFAYTKTNGGASSARNYGLERITGEYVAFIDCDDTVEPGFLKTLYQNAINCSAKLSACGMRLIKNGRCISAHRNAEFKRFNHLQAIAALLSEKYILFSPCDKLYHRSLFETVRFEEGVLHEDVLFTYQILKLCDKAVCETKPLYNYNLHGDSVTGSAFSEKHLYDITAREKIAADVEKNYPDFVPNAMSTKLVGYLNIANRLINSKTEIRKKYLPQIIRAVRKDRGLYINNPYISYKKQLGVFLLCIGATAYKVGYTFSQLR